MHYFWQFKDNNSDKWPFFSSYFWALAVIDIHFLYLKIVKIHFHGVPSLVHSETGKNLNFGVESCEIRSLSHFIQETYKLRVEKQICLISWPITFCSLLVTFWYLFITFYSLLVNICSLFVTLLLVARYFLLVACYFFVHCMLWNYNINWEKTR